MASHVLLISSYVAQRHVLIARHVLRNNRFDLLKKLQLLKTRMLLKRGVIY
jgi:hypothetical protein